MQDESPAESFPVNLGGDIIACRSFEDAEAIRRAAEILDRLDGETYPQPLIEYLSALLRWYGRQRASRTLEGRHAASPVALPAGAAPS